MASRGGLLARSLRSSGDQTALYAFPRWRRTGRRIGSRCTATLRSLAAHCVAVEISTAGPQLTSTPIAQTGKTREAVHKHGRRSVGLKPSLNGKAFFHQMHSKWQLWTGFIESCNRFPERPAID